MVGPWVEGPQLVGGPSLSWGMASGEAQRMYTAGSRGKAKFTPESLGLPR